MLKHSRGLLSLQQEKKKAASDVGRLGQAKSYLSDWSSWCFMGFLSAYFVGWSSSSTLTPMDCVLLSLYARGDLCAETKKKRLPKQLEVQNCPKCHCVLWHHDFHIAEQKGKGQAKQP